MTKQFAYLLVVTEMGYESEVVEDLKEIPEVAEVHTVYGVYDLITKIRGDDLDHLKLIAGQIRRINKVRTTLVMIVNSPAIPHVAEKIGRNR